MDATTGLIITTVIYGILLFFDNFFKTCAHYPYIKFLEGTGFKINFFSINWKTKAFNRLLIRWGNSKPHFLNIWFTIGTYAAIALLPLSIFLLFYSFFQQFFSSDSNSKPIIEPILLGVNLPASELGYYSLALILCSIVHELGHALAAVLEDVNIIEVGANILFILPVAFVNISSEKLASLGKQKTLNILCAGIWHNLVLCLAAFLVHQSLPTLFTPFFHINEGITVTNIVEKSHLLGSKGLEIGDSIFKINDCPIKDENSWYECLQELNRRKTAYCIESDLIHRLDESGPLRYLENGNIDCCSSSKTKNICFEYVDTVDGILELPNHVCLPGRAVVESSLNLCTDPPHKCPNSLYCFKPLLANNTNLFRIYRNGKSSVIYHGLVKDIFQTIEVSSYIPKKMFKTTTLPDILAKFFKYIVVFSLGLGIINVLPFMYMDGQHIFEVLGMALLRKKFGKSKSRQFTVVITWLFTLLLLVHCLVTFGKVLL